MLLTIEGKTVIERCIDAFYECCSKIIVVTGRYHEDIGILKDLDTFEEYENMITVQKL